jgi:hypothetical protein
LNGDVFCRPGAFLAQTYLSEIEAPKKLFVWFENSAHSPPFETLASAASNSRDVVEGGLTARATGEEEL